MITINGHNVQNLDTPKWKQLYNDDTGRYEVPYRFTDQFNYDENVKDNLKAYLSWMNDELDQCLEFVERPEENFYFSRLNIISAGDGCWSYIGRLYWEQYIRKDLGIFNSFQSIKT